MIDQSDQQENIEAKIQHQLNLIYDDLSSKYDRVDDELVQNDPLDTISVIIENFWNIPQSTIKIDLQHEMERQSQNKVGIPDIPTYRIRFAIEEGSWSVLFRNYLKTILKEEFNHLLTLEELIWGSGAAQREDLAYYLLELYQIGEKFVRPIFNVWKRHHDYATWEDFSPVIIAGYHQATINRGLMMVQGASRLVKTKLDDLREVEKFDNNSPWSIRAKETFSLLENANLEDRNDPKVEMSLITIALLQRQLMIKRSTKNNLDQDTSNQSGISWQNLDPSNLEERERFSELILRRLYRRTEEEPLDAALKLLHDFLTENDYKVNIQLLFEQLRSKIMKEQEEGSNQIDAIQHQLPKLLIDLKKKEIQSNKETLSLQNVENLPIWDVFFDNISRIKRIQDEDHSLQIINKALLTVYNILIDRGMRPIVAVTKTFDMIREEFQIDTKIFNQQIELIRNYIDDQDNDPSLKEIDEFIIKSISEFIHKLMLDKKLS